MNALLISEDFKNQGKEVPSIVRRKQLLEQEGLNKMTQAVKFNEK